jgi:hypothetical protein
MEIPKDMYDYLTQFADDQTILKIISVNKKYSDPVFFEKIMKRKYPLLLRFKSKDETMKNLYLNMIRWISKLKEEFRFVYQPDFVLNPKEFYMFLKLLSNVMYQFEHLEEVEDDENMISIVLEDPNKTRFTPRLIQIFKNQVHKLVEDSHNIIDIVKTNIFPEISDFIHMFLNEEVREIDLNNGADIIIIIKYKNLYN